MRKSQQVSLTALFASLHVVLYFVPFGVWRNWAIYIEPLEGIILGPKMGFLAALLGSSIARMIRPDLFWMFGIIAEPVSVLMVGFVSRNSWKPALAAYAIMLSAYFIHPFGRELPLWTVLDILLALVLIYPAARSSTNLFGSNYKKLPTSVLLIAFVCIATDSLARVFLLIPGGLYAAFPDIFGNFNGLYTIFVGAAADSYIEDLIVVGVSFLVTTPLLITLSKLKLMHKQRKDEN